LELASSLELAERAASADAKSWSFAGTRASVYYRLGELEKAVAEFTKLLEGGGQTSNDDGPTGVDATRNVARNGLFFAMALHQTGQKEEGLKWLAKATTAIQELTRDKNADGSENTNRAAWYDRLELDLLLREANELIVGRVTDSQPAKADKVP
jgi:tetratricopeptide (TPR) repeat protein